MNRQHFLGFAEPTLLDTNPISSYDLFNKPTVGLLKKVHMARLVKEEVYAEKRNDILDSALRLVYSKGYERMTIQDILDDLSISKGAFYHYFDSKQAVLEALSERMLDEMEAVAAPISDDPTLPALRKFERFFSAIINWKLAQKTLVVTLMRVWFEDNNAILRQKVDSAVTRRLAPPLSRILQQGVEEGVFRIGNAEQVAKVILSIIRGLQDTLAELFLTFEAERDEDGYVENMVAAHEAFVDALERIVGAPSGFLYRLDVETIRQQVNQLMNSA